MSRWLVGSSSSTRSGSSESARAKSTRRRNPPESVFQKLAIAKAELLSLKIKLHKDQAAKEELKNFLDKLQKDGKDTTLKLVSARINAIDAQINAQVFRARLIKAVNTQDAEEMEKLATKALRGGFDSLDGYAPKTKEAKKIEHQGKDISD